MLMTLLPFPLPMNSNPLLRRRHSSRVDAQLAVSDNLLDLALLLQVIQCLPRQTPIDLQSIDKGGDGDEAVGLDVFVEFVRGGFIEDDGVVGLVLDCAAEGRGSAHPGEIDKEMLAKGMGGAPEGG